MGEVVSAIGSIGSAVVALATGHLQRKAARSAENAASQVANSAVAQSTTSAAAAEQTNTEAASRNATQNAARRRMSVSSTVNRIGSSGGRLTLN